MGFEPHQPEPRLETVHEFQDQMDSTLSEPRSMLAKAKEDMAQYYNQCRVLALEYHIGDRVYLDVRISVPHVCKVFTLLLSVSLITIELEPDILYIKGILNDSCDGL